MKIASCNHCWLQGLLCANQVVQLNQLRARNRDIHAGAKRITDHGAGGNVAAMAPPSTDMPVR